jgi:ornithine cyclodeaminase/alanine dehydrogenase-like protein (mu-crystallin family)
MSATLMYGPAEIRAAVGFEELIDPVGRALSDFSRGLGASPVSVFAPAGADGDVHVKSAWLPGRRIFTVKVATWFAAKAARGEPPGGGVVGAFDASTGDLLALLRDEHHLSDVRTAAAGAVAARLLARPDASRLGVLGTGVQAYLQALAAAAVLPIRSVLVWGRDEARARRLAAAVGRRRPDLSIEVVASVRAAVEPADILVTATASTAPLVEAAWLRPGQHVTTVGADDAGKCELAPACLARADRLIVDSRALAPHYGNVHRAIAAGAISADDIDGELGEVVMGTVPGRLANHELSIATLIGLGVQDLVAAQLALERLPTARVGEPPASAIDLLFPPPEAR